MTNQPKDPQEPTVEQPDYDAPGNSEHSAPHGGSGSPSDDAPGQNKPKPNQDLPDTDEEQQS